MLATARLVASVHHIAETAAPVTSPSSVPAGPAAPAAPVTSPTFFAVLFAPARAASDALGMASLLHALVRRLLAFILPLVPIALASHLPFLRSDASGGALRAGALAAVPAASASTNRSLADAAPPPTRFGSPPLPASTTRRSAAAPGTPPDASAAPRTPPLGGRRTGTRRRHVTGAASTIAGSVVSSRRGGPGPGTASVTASVGRPHRAFAARKKTLVIDLDECLVHSSSRALRQPDHMVEVTIEHHRCLYYVYKRPHVDFFLQKVAEWYRVVIFTASMQEYADPVIDFMDPQRTIAADRFFRQHCRQHGGTYLKDLTVIDPDLSQVCLLDNSPVSYALQQANGIPIEGWVGDPLDEALLDMLPFLDALRFTEDVRSVLGLKLYPTL
ncbi:dullard-like phosphatase domain-containing protein [Allomyces macrogynus ATCC 38327]|uniref:Dullard-like phosphatase domain-containing protein n=1 Tax=Allomyces macrogynus (strain ATCC 38327) TaxID=578462 RepID=A0A0L0TEL7_ALLM3|nr:dullard-like phosphatase domain-containing protein, variant [Allomyces macrogynus ATCC 38327]KNE73140.1 dullard-like phosphatase domain-containing protein [Allomyces macrogynus ATCC 38327]|eukprot:KNE73139.1 dullard-like phosphatase domain-containing protein, variant [Allomyces macrogynus ATCC 38327]